MQPLQENIFFQIGKTVITDEEQAKIDNLVKYLNKNKKATVSITGYADSATGTSSRNLQLSKMRAEGVSAALQKAGISADRIHIDYKGDKVQPFAKVEENRVSVCIAE